MKEINNLECPLCMTPAIFEYQDWRNKKHILCSKCHEFIVSKAAERKLNKEEDQQKSLLSNFASSAPEGTILVIEGPDLSKPKDQNSINYNYRVRQEEIK